MLVYHRPCTGCNNIQVYDGWEDGLLNMASYVVAYDILRSVMHSFCWGEVSSCWRILIKLTYTRLREKYINDKHVHVDTMWDKMEHNFNMFKCEINIILHELLPYIWVNVLLCYCTIFIMQHDYKEMILINVFIDQVISQLTYHYVI
jgi:hypothetical protein